MDQIFLILLLAILGYAAVKDGQIRQIPNRVSLLLVVMGIFAAYLPKESFFFLPLSVRVSGFLIPAIALLIIYVRNTAIAGGGDIKLISALGFCLGLPALVFILTAASGCGAVYGILRRRRSIPFAPFIFAGALLFFLWR